MNFQDFEKLRESIRGSSLTVWQMCLLYREVAGRVCDCEEFAAIKQEISDLEEVMVEALDRFEEAKPYQPDPADAVTVD